MKFFIKKKSNHGIECDCGCNKILNLIEKNKDEFYFFPCIRYIKSNFKGNFFKGEYLGNGFKKTKISIKFLNYKIEKEKTIKIK